MPDIAVTSRNVTDTARRSSTAAPRMPKGFWRMWNGVGLSNLGDSIVFVASGLLALTLTADERLLSVVTAMLYAAWIVVALPAGVVIDRLDRQRLMAGANLLRVVAAAMVALLTVADRITIWWLLALLAVIGTCEVVFDSTSQALTAMLVPRHQLSRANGLVFTAEVIAGSILGLGLGAVLFDLHDGMPFAVTAVAYSIGAALIGSITLRRARFADPSPTADGDPVASATMRSSMSWLWGNDLLRLLAMLTSLAAASYMLSVGIVAKFAIVELGLSAVEFGVLISVNAMGAAIGGFISARAMEVLGTRTALVASYVAVAGGMIAIGLLGTVWAIAAVYVVIGIAIMLWNVATLTIRQERIPAEQFGRVNGVYRWLAGVSNVVGIVAGGFVAHATSLPMPFVVGGVAMLAGGAALAVPFGRALAAG